MGPRTAKRESARDQHRDLQSLEQLREDLKRTRAQLSKNSGLLDQLVLETRPRPARRRLLVPALGIIVSLVTLVAGAVCLGIYNERDFQPPAATTTTNKGAKIAGIPASQITVTSSSRERLNADLVTEAHITSTRAQAYALELRKQMDQPLLACEPESADCPAELFLGFDFKAAPVKSVTISLDFGSQVSPAHVYFYGSSGSAVELTDSDGKPTPGQLTRLTKPEGSDFRIMVHIKQLLSMSWPSDTGFTRPLIRVGVTPSARNTASSGPYFALRLPLVRTLQSNTSMIVEHPGAGEPRLLHPVTGFRQKREIIDETGQAQLSPGVTPDLASTVPPSRFGDDFSPAILYTDQAAIVANNKVRNVLLALSSALVALGVSLLLSSLAGFRKAKRG